MPCHRVYLFLSRAFLDSYYPVLIVNLDLLPDSHHKAGTASCDHHRQRERHHPSRYLYCESRLCCCTFSLPIRYSLPILTTSSLSLTSSSSHILTIITHQDVVDNLAATGADGIMSAEGLLDDPALFARQNLRTPSSSSASSSSSTSSSSSSSSSPSPPSCVSPSPLSLALEYLDLVQVLLIQYIPPSPPIHIFHT